MLSFFVMKKFTGSSYFKLIFGSSLVCSSLIFIFILIENRPDLSSDFGMPIKSVSSVPRRSLSASGDRIDCCFPFRYEMKFPTNLPEVKQIVNVLSQYKKEHINYVILLFASAYIFKQSFGIPGSFLLVGIFIDNWSILGQYLVLLRI